MDVPTFVEASSRTSSWGAPRFWLLSSVSYWPPSFTSVWLLRKIAFCTRLDCVVIIESQRPNQAPRYARVLQIAARFAIRPVCRLLRPRRGLLHRKRPTVGPNAMSTALLLAADSSDSSDDGSYVAHEESESDDEIEPRGARCARDPRRSSSQRSRTPRTRKFGDDDARGAAAAAIALSRPAPSPAGSLQEAHLGSTRAQTRSGYAAYGLCATR